MMDFKIVMLSVDEKTIVPTLLVKIQFSYPYGREALISISGELVSANATILGQLSEYSRGDNAGQHLWPQEDMKQKNISLQNYAEFATLICPLSRAAIEHIEQLRSLDSQHSVKLNFRIRLRSMALPTSLLDPKITALNNPFVAVNIQKQELPHTIQQSGWLNDFAGPLGIGDFVILELKMPQGEVPEQWREMFETMKRAVDEMRTAIRQHDWKKVLITSRGVFEPLKFNENQPSRARLKQELKALFLSQQHDDNAFSAWYRGVLSFFDYSSKFVHILDQQGGYMPQPICTREDAYLVYGLAVSTLNLLFSKVRS